MARQIVSAMAEAQIIGQGTASDIQAIYPVQTQDLQSSKRPFTLAVRGTSDERSQKAQGKTCWRCGSVNHTADYNGCPAKDTWCNSCKNGWHFAKVFQGSKQVHEVTVPDVNVLSVDNRARDADKTTSTCNVWIMCHWLSKNYTWVVWVIRYLCVVVCLRKWLLRITVRLLNFI